MQRILDPHQGGTGHVKMEAMNLMYYSKLKVLYKSREIIRRFPAAVFFESHLTHVRISRFLKMLANTPVYDFKP